MEDAVARYCAASEAGDLDGLASTLSADVRMPSPLFGRMTFKGRSDVRALLTVVYAYLEKGAVTQAISGPIDLGRPKGCPADGRRRAPTAHKKHGGTHHKSAKKAVRRGHS